MRLGLCLVGWFKKVSIGSGYDFSVLSVIVYHTYRQAIGRQANACKTFERAQKAMRIIDYQLVIPNLQFLISEVNQVSQQS